MDTLTHGLSGILAARIMPRARVSRLSMRARLAAGFGAAIFPDSDFIVRLVGIVSYLNTHRGVTHSIVMAPLWALLIAYLLAWLSRGRYQWRDFYWVSLLGLVVHIAGDLITAYGTMVWAPLTTWKLSWPTTFIIDFYFSGIIVLTLLLAWYARRYSQGIALAGGVILIAYIGLQGWSRYQALEVAGQYAAEQQLTVLTMDALPQPLSPFNWKLIIATEHEYRVGYINLYRREPIVADETTGWLTHVNAVYQPPGQLDWQRLPYYPLQPEAAELAKQIWHSEALHDIRAFMLYPGSLRVDESQCAWFVDQRFVLDVMRMPFIFGGCIESDESIKLYRLNEGVKIPVL